MAASLTKASKLAFKQSASRQTIMLLTTGNRDEQRQPFLLVLSSTAKVGFVTEPEIPS
jgi:hypothetical protein